MTISLNLRTGSSQALLLESDAPRGRLIVAHGAGNDCRYSFAPFFAAARARGWQVASFDLPGHGRGNTSIFEVAHAVADFTEAVEQVRMHMTRPDIPWFLLGNSLGGSLALRAVLQERLQPRGLVTVGTPVFLHRGWRLAIGELPSLCSPAMRGYRAHVGSWREVFPAFGAFRRDEFPIRCDREAYLDAVATVLNQTWGPPAPAAPPTLMIQGQRDAVARLAETRAWIAERQAAGMPIHLEAVPGVGHLDVMLHGGIQEKILDWLDSQLARNP